MKETTEVSKTEVESSSGVQSQGGTQANREAGKEVANSGADTTAPGVPQPQSGGPEPTSGSPAQGAANKS